MMEQPKMPMLTLDLQKTTTYNTVPLRLTQGDKGYIQPFTLTNAFQQYTVTADVLGFRAMKPDGKYIEIQNEPARFALADGVWEFNLPDELTQAIGTVTGAYFYVQSGTNIVASTTKFNYSISAAWSSDEQSNNYVTAFEELEQKLRDTVSAGATTVNGLNNYSNEAKATLTKSLNDLTASVNTWKTTTTTAVDKVLADEKTALQKAQSAWNAEYNKAVAYYANMATEWTAKKASYDKLAADEIAKMEADKKTVIDKFASDSAAKLTAVQNSLNDLESKKTSSLADFETKKTDALADLEADKATALNKIASDGAAKVSAIQASYDTLNTTMTSTLNKFKTDAASALNLLATDKATALAAIETDKQKALTALTTEKNAAIAKIGTDSTAKLLAIQSDYDTFKNGMKTTLDGLLKDVPALESRVTALTTQLDDIDIVSVKAASDKATADVATLTKSMVKSATVNGGTKVTPDSVGNLALTVPNPDLSPYAKNADLANLQKAVADKANKTEVESAITSAKTAMATDVQTTRYSKTESDQRYAGTILKPFPTNITDMHQLKTDGVYYLKNLTDEQFTALANKPMVTVDKWATVIVRKNSSTNGMQLWLETNRVAAFMQTWNDSGSRWPTWEYLSNTGNYSNADIDTKVSTVNNRVSQLESNTINGLYSKVQADSRFALLADFNTLKNGMTSYVTNSALTLKLASYYDKTTADSRYLPKTTSFATPAQVTTAETNAKNYAKSLADQAPKIRQMTQSAYDSLATKDSNTLYIIVDGVV